MKIQITCETKTLLDTLGGFVTEPRGQVLEDENGRLFKIFDNYLKPLPNDTGVDTLGGFVTEPRGQVLDGHGNR